MYEPFVSALSCLNLLLCARRQMNQYCRFNSLKLLCLKYYVFLLLPHSMSHLITASKMFLCICSNESSLCPWRCRFSCRANTQSTVNTYIRIPWHRDLCNPEGRLNIHKRIFMVGLFDLRCFLCLPCAWCDADVLPIKLVFLLIRLQYLVWPAVA